MKIRNDLHRTTYYYVQQANLTYVLLKESRQHLERGAGSTLSIKLSILLNMGLMYCYALYEAFTREYFRKIYKYEFNMIEDEFDNQYHRFHDIKIKIIKEKYNIYLPKNMFNVLILLQKARNAIGHKGKNAVQDFEVVVGCFSTIIEYFKYISFRMAKRLKFLFDMYC